MSIVPKRLPPWLRVPFRGAKARAEVRRLLHGLQLETVCENAQCPNLCECWRRRTATFMILGRLCTRDCRFCAVGHGVPLPPDPAEPARVAEAAATLNLAYVVVTSVTRDDLPDGGAAAFAATIREIRARLPVAGVEVLTPDFGGRERDVATVVAAGPSVFNHNIETCARLTTAIRSGAEYTRSLRVLATAARLAGDAGTPRVKSGFMLGLGETAEEVRAALADLRTAGVGIVTIGQYLPPSSRHWPVARYVTPEEFADWGKVARDEYGFAHVFSAPLVRSSYLADQVA